MRRLDFLKLTGTGVLALALRGHSPGDIVPDEIAEEAEAASEPPKMLFATAASATYCHLLSFPVVPQVVAADTGEVPW